MVLIVSADLELSLIIINENHSRITTKYLSQISFIPLIMISISNDNLFITTQISCPTSLVARIIEFPCTMAIAHIKLE